jgi:hypothetical protein
MKIKTFGHVDERSTDVAPRRSARGGWRRSRGHSDAEASSGSRGPLDPVDPRESGKVG